MELEKTKKPKIMRPLALFVTGLMTALAVLCYFWEKGALFLFFAFLGLALVCWFFCNRKRAFFACLLLFSGAAAACALWIVFTAYIYEPVLDYADRGGIYAGYVEDTPQVYDDYSRMIVRIDRRGGASVRPFRARVYLDGDYGALRPGDRIEAALELSVPESAGQFDTRRYLRSHGVYLSGFGETAQIEACEEITLSSRLKRLAGAIGTRIETLMPQKPASMLRALLYGDESGLSGALSRELRITGLSHITAVSGMNVAFIVGIILALLRRKAGTIPAIVTVVLFVLMTGAQASVVRAGIMQVVYLLSFVLRREPDTRTSLFFSALLILAFNPFSIADLGFLLSFFSTLGIVLLQNPMQQGMKARIPVKNPALSRFLNGVFAVVSTTLSASLFILPVQMIFFGEISVIAPLSNLLVLWAAEYAFTLGALACIFAFVWHPLGVVLAFFPRLLCSFILWIVPLLARIPYASIGAKSIYLILAFVCAAGIALIPRFDRRVRQGFAVLCAVLVFLAGFAFAVAERESTYTFSAIYTGSGQTAILCAGQGSIVFNAGNGGYAASGISGLLSDQGVTRIDVLIVSSYRNADCAGAESLLSMCSAAAVYLPAPETDEEQAMFNALSEAAEVGGGSAEALSEDRSIPYHGLTLDIYVNHSDDADSGRLTLYAHGGANSLLALGALQSENLGRLLVTHDVHGASFLALGSYYSDRPLPGIFRMLAVDHAVLSPYASADERALALLSEAGAQALVTARRGSVSLRVPR